MGNEYNRIARSKIAELIRRPDFKGIVAITSTKVILEFESKVCSVCEYGRTDWI